MKDKDISRITTAQMKYMREADKYTLRNNERNECALEK
jgi:hypothetical protein